MNWQYIFNSLYFNDHGFLNQKIQPKVNIQE